MFDYSKMKFRVWDKTHNYFLEDMDEQGMIFFTKEYNGWQPLNMFLSLSRYEIQQCTGLKDKNGKEIYEGDIILDKLGTGWILEVYYEEGAFRGKNLNPDVYLFIFGLKDRLVIGNIFETPNLLKPS